MAWLWASGAALVGALQARSIARSAGHSANAAYLLLRMACVGAALFLAARSGHLVVGVAGWLLGYALACAVLQRRFG